MKILHVITSLEIGGAQRLLSDLLPILKEECESEVLVMYSAENSLVDKLKDSSIPIHSLERKDIYNPLNVFRLKKYLNGYDILHVHLFPVEYWVPIASWFSKTKLVYTEHSTSNRRRSISVFRLIDRWIYYRYDRIISISSETQGSLTKWLKTKFGDNRFIVINNGINTSRFSNVQRSDIISDDKVALMMVSRFAPSKDQKTVIRALAQLDDKYHLYFIGDGSLLEETKCYAHEMGVSDKVTFLGARDDVPELVASCDIGIQSSNWEGFGLTAVEIMAAGKPVIASDVDGLNHVVKGAGLLFDRGNDAQLADLIKRLTDNRREYINVAERCKKRAQNYDIKYMAKEYLKVYLSLTGGVIY